MSPDLVFWLSLLVKMLITASFVVVAAYAAERAGPIVGAMIATLPIAAGPAYLFLALDHDAQFISHSALISLVVNASTGIFALIYSMLAQKRGLFWSVAPALAVWVVLAMIVRALPWNVWTAVGFNIVVFAVCLYLGDRLRHAQRPVVTGRWYDLFVRAGMVAILVATVVGLSTKVGPIITGILAVFPIVLLSLMLILHLRIGGPANAAVLSNSLLGLVGFSLCCLTAHVAVAQFGTPTGLTLALVVAIAANFGFWALRRGAAKPAAATAPPSPPRA